MLKKIKRLILNLYYLYFVKDVKKKMDYHLKRMLEDEKFFNELQEYSKKEDEKINKMCGL